MIRNWRERLNALQQRLTGVRKEPSARVEEPALEEKPLSNSTKPRTSRAAVKPGVPEIPAALLGINLGIDFGTSFTKVCFRDVGSEASGVVTFGGRSAKNALIATVVCVDKDGMLFLENDVPEGKDCARVRYLKMRLAGIPIDGASAIAGFGVDECVATRALASWFLASVIARSQTWIARHEKDRLKRRSVVWSANVGVPVEPYDSAALKTFEEVLAVAWQWVKDGTIPRTVRDAAARYEQALSVIKNTVSDLHAVPEIAAAVQSFIISREAVPGFHVYFDIGGGTVDGVAFNFVNSGSEKRINFHSGKVAPIGVSAIAEAIGWSEPSEVDAKLLEQALGKRAKAVREAQAHNVRSLVADVVVTAKRKDGRNWQRDIFQYHDRPAKRLGRLKPSQMRPLIVFVGGGGAQSPWYCSAIETTYEQFHHKNAGIPPYHLIEVPKPKDLDMHGLPDEEFRRFAISYGLSIPFGEGPDIALPSEIAPADKPKPWRPPGVPDGGYSKDVC